MRNLYGRQTWKQRELRSKVYLAVRAAGETGASRKRVIANTGANEKTVDLHLRQMLQEGYLQRPVEGGVVEGHGRYAAGPSVPPIEGLLTERALEMISDCPAGVSDTVLCRELACSLGHLHEALEFAQRAGVVERIFMPAAHGGGQGWAQTGMEAARKVPDRLPVAEMRHEHVRLPVMEVDIDRVHAMHRPDVFAVDLNDGRLAITTGSVRFSLPPDHTERLMRFLAPHVQRLSDADALRQADTAERRPEFTAAVCTEEAR